MDLEKLKLKTSSQLLPEEKEFIKQNQDKLNDEDKEAYADFLAEDTDEVVDDSSGDASVDDENADDTTEEAADDNASTDDETKEPQETKSVFQFNSEDEAKDFVKKIQEEDAAKKKAAIEAAQTPEEKRYIEENWKPIDWNDAAVRLTDVVMQRIEEKTQAEQKAIEDSNKKLDAEWLELSKQHSIPDRTTDEGKKIHDSVVQVAIRYNLSTFHDAYDLWSKIATDQGGGYKISASEAGATLAEKKKEQVSTQKKVASKINTNNQGSGQKQTGNLQTPDYDTLHKAKDVHDLLRKTGVIS